MSQELLGAILCFFYYVQELPSRAQCRITQRNETKDYLSVYRAVGPQARCLVRIPERSPVTFLVLGPIFRDRRYSQER